MRSRSLFVLSLGLICALAAQANAGLGDGLVAHYPFNGNANDESGNGNHGTVYGAALVDDKDGNPDSAYGFDGIDDYIDCGVPSYVLTTSGTICGWLRLNRNDAVMNIMTETSGIGRAEWAVNVGSAETGPTGRLGFFISPTGEGGLDWVVVHSDTVLPTSEWLHFTATYDGGKMRVYIDAVEEASLDETRSIYSGGAKLLHGPFG